MFADFRLGGTNRIGARHHSARMLPLEGFTFRLSRRQIATESHSPPAFPSEHLLVFDDFRLGGLNRISTRRHSARMLIVEGFTLSARGREVAIESLGPLTFPSERLLVFDDFRLGGTNRTAPVTTVGRPAEDRMLSDYLKR